MATALTSSTPRLLRHASRAIRSRTLTTTTTTTTTAAEAAQQMLRTFQGQTSTRRQTLDAHQLQKLSLTLNRPHLHPGLDVTSAPPPEGTPLPRAYHLAYLQPASIESDLGPDGTDRTFNAPAPFTRRMWAGGAMRWLPAKWPQPLRVGDEVEERTRLVGATAKRSGRDGGEMVLVEVEKEFWRPGGLALVDRRSWVFRPPAAATTTTAAAAAAVCGEGASGPLLAGRRSSVEDVKGLDGSGGWWAESWEGCGDLLCCCFMD